jgi:hypothetical protein
MLGMGQRVTLAQRAMFGFMLSPGNAYERGVRSCDARVYVSVNLYPRSCLGTVNDLNRTSKRCGIYHYGTTSSMRTSERPPHQKQYCLGNVLLVCICLLC